MRRIYTRSKSLKRARTLRREETEAEKRLWGHLRDSRLQGWKFRRQVPIGPFFVDFMCEKAKLAIEVDGFTHDSIGAAKSDAARSHYLRWQHVATLRVPAKLVLEDLHAAVARIVEVSGQRVKRLLEMRSVPPHHPADGPPPPVGED